ncbi:MAG: glycosyltransferase domain-containing protein, partial [Smithella sp.]
MGIFQNKIKKYIAYKQQRKATGCVYTCLTDRYDNLPNHLYFDGDLDYICFTDDVSLAETMRDSIWEFRPLIYSASDSVRNSRYHKLHPHEFLQDYEYSIWVDSNIDVRTPYLFKLIYENSDKKLLMPIHYERDCIYDEIAEVIDLKLDNYNTVLKQREFLLNNKMPEHYGLTETNIVYRKHNDAADVIKIMNEWWFLIENFSKR